MSDVKICVSCHKDCLIADSSLLLPVQAGADTARQRLDMTGDNTGDNISAKNGRYCELSVQYWAWKNLEADFYGFFHYRRYMAFDTSVDKDEIKLDYPNGNKAKSLLTADDNIRALTDSFPLILPRKHKSRYFLNNKWQYALPAAQNIKDLQFCIDKIKADYPDMRDCARDFLKERSSYYYNMFVMSKELFFPYCSWLFDILFEHEKHCDLPRKSLAAQRVSGYLGERLCSIYVKYLQECKGIDALHCPVIIFDKPCN